jgi:hypothetical protein
VTTRIDIIREWARSVPIDLREDLAARLLTKLDAFASSKLSGTLSSLYRFCESEAVDLELRLKADGRGHLAFYRVIDGARRVHEFDLEGDDDHSIHAALMRVKFPPVLSEEDRIRLETPR